MKPRSTKWQEAWDSIRQRFKDRRSPYLAEHTGTQHHRTQETQPLAVASPPSSPALGQASCRRSAPPTSARKTPDGGPSGATDDRSFRAFGILGVRGRRGRDSIAMHLLRRSLNQIGSMQSSPIHSYLYHDIARALDLDPQDVRRLCVVDGGSNGFKVLRPDLTLDQAFAEIARTTAEDDT
jgi:hypothetical protein